MERGFLGIAGGVYSGGSDRSPAQEGEGPFNTITAKLGKAGTCFVASGTAIAAGAIIAKYVPHPGARIGGTVLAIVGAASISKCGGLISVQ